MGGIIGVKKPAQRAADAAVAMQGQLQVALNDMRAQIAETRHEIVTKMIPQVNRTLDVAIDSMQSVVVSVKNIEGNLTKVLARVDDTVLTAKFTMEIVMIFLFLLIVMICGYELNRLKSMVRPNVFYRTEIDLLHLLRLACIISGIVVVARVFYIVFLQQSEATPIELTLLALFPFIAILGFKVLCLVVFLLQHIFQFLRFVLWAPFMIIVYPVFYIWHLTFIAPFVWLYRVYQARLRLRNQYAIPVMHSLVLILPLFFLKMIDLITYITGDYQSHHPVVYALIATYALFYLIALDIKLTYPVPPPRQQVRQVYAVRYPQQQHRRY